MRALNIIFLVLFLLSAALQYNDPDPYIWMPLYLSGALVCYYALTDRYCPVLCVSALAVYIPYAAYLFVAPDGVWSWLSEHRAESIVQTMKASQPWIEETREFFGLVLLVIAVTANMLWVGKRTDPESTPTAFCESATSRKESHFEV